MAKVRFYKVIKNNPLWEVGAIISDAKAQGHFVGIEDIWDKHKDMTEYLSGSIIENSPKFFQRVYKSKLSGDTYITAEEFKKLIKKKSQE